MALLFLFASLLSDLDPHEGKQNNLWISAAIFLSNGSDTDSLEPPLLCLFSSAQGLGLVGSSWDCVVLYNVLPWPVSVESRILSIPLTNCSLEDAQESSWGCWDSDYLLQL